MIFQDSDRQLLLMVPRMWGFVGALAIVVRPLHVSDLPIQVTAGFWLVGIGLLYFVARVPLGGQSHFARRVDERFPLPE